MASREQIIGPDSPLCTAGEMTPDKMEIWTLFGKKKKIIFQIMSSVTDSDLIFFFLVSYALSEQFFLSHFPARRLILSISGWCVDTIWVCVNGFLSIGIRLEVEGSGFPLQNFVQWRGGLLISTLTGISHNTINSYQMNFIFYVTWYFFLTFSPAFLVWEVIKISSLFSIRIRVSKVWWFPDGILPSHLICWRSHFVFSRHPTCPPAI